MSESDTITQELESGMLLEYSWTYSPACCAWVADFMGATDSSSPVIVFVCRECNGYWFTDEHGMLWYEQLAIPLSIHL